MIDLRQLLPTQLAELSAGIHERAQAAGNMEACAQTIVRYFYETFGDGNGGRACALVRCFKTHRLATLPPDLKEAARNALDEETHDPDLKCLVLLGTAGSEAPWNSRLESVGHKAIPLPSAKMVARFPMISQVMKQLGVDITRVLRSGDDLVMDLTERTYNIFYVADAQDSPYIPAQQQFVKPFGIRTVLGFGGVLPSGELFVTVLFTRIEVPRAKAELFKPLAVSVKTALIPFDTSDAFV